MRATSVGLFRRGGCAYLHTHQGPGIRCLIEGGIRNRYPRRLDVLRTGRPRGSNPAPSRFFSRRAPIVRRAFIRVMILPPRAPRQRARSPMSTRMTRRGRSLSSTGSSSMSLSRGKWSLRSASRDRCHGRIGGRRPPARAGRRAGAPPRPVPTAGLERMRHDATMQLDQGLGDREAEPRGP